MKIKSVEDLQDEIDREMSWRKRELTSIKANIKQADGLAKNTALRSGVTLLYAHWEGSVKNIASFYLSYVSNLKLPYSCLKNNFLAISVKQKLTLFEETGKATIHTNIVSEIFKSYDEKSCIPDKRIIKTKSNLNSEIFIEIMATIGLSCADYESSYNLLDTVLLQMRNTIAHGERMEAISLDEGRYNSMHEKVSSLMDLFSSQILNAAISKEYLLKDAVKSN